MKHALCVVGTPLLPFRIASAGGMVAHILIAGGEEMLTYAAHSVGRIEFDGAEPLARGPWIAKFEQALSSAVGVEHAVAVNSGTNAIYLAVRASGLTGKRVAVPSITFCGTANAVICAGATPVYADVGPDGNISGEWLLANSDKWDAVIPVHYAGNLCDMPRIKEIAGDRPIIVDACHALGAAGVMEHATAACFSFHPAKQITTGEGGAVLTNDPATAFRLRTLRHNGIGSAWEGGVRQNIWLAPSLNFWMSDVAAKIGCGQLENLAIWQIQREKMADMYCSNLPEWAVPTFPQGKRFEDSAWCMFPILLPKDFPIPRYGLMNELLRRGIETQIHYHPLHLQPVGKGKPGDLPGAEDFGARVLTLPLHNKMTVDDVLRVCSALKEIHG